jgi:hypothetical protein
MADTNPFEVLRLDPVAGEQEIVRQAGRLRQRATGEEAINAIRRAVGTLTASAMDRALYALLTHPRPAWQSPALDRVAAAFRRPPIPAPTPPPALDMQEFTALVCAAAADGLALPEVTFEAVPAAEDPEEIRRQTAEALWQSLVFDPGT